MNPQFEIGEACFYKTAKQLRPTRIVDFNLDRSQVFAKKLSRLHWINVASLQKIEANKPKAPRAPKKVKTELEAIRYLLRVRIKPDYSHPWPNEDAGTTKHRLNILEAIETALKPQTN